MAFTQQLYMLSSTNGEPPQVLKLKWIIGSEHKAGTALSVNDGMMKKLTCMDNPATHKFRPLTDDFLPGAEL